MANLFKKFALVAPITVILIGMIWPGFLYLLLVILPIIAVGYHDLNQTKHALRRNFPVVGRMRWVMEAVRPFLRQYLFESETDGAPVNRMFRSVIYQRAKGDRDTTPYGTKLDTQQEGYEWVGHSMAAIHYDSKQPQPRVIVGGPDCTQPYAASIFNVSAMSYGALSHNAIRALNKGALQGGFYHNTGEGSISPYHLETGGDLVWQIGTGYFGCRDDKGDFCPSSFQKSATKPNVKMIEIKLSQGAKPGHGGILPADKNTIEIAEIRHVEAGTQVNSPPTHSAFSTPLELMAFIQKLRSLSDGKPIGFKLCLGRGSEFIALCKAMVETGVKPDFITVDGGEGGTGAAPLEYSNAVGMPLRDALAFVTDALVGFDLKKDVTVIASGKVFTGFHLAKNLALGADICNSARGMMIALGCVQSLVCNTNECPTGIATQDPELAKAIDVGDKSQRIARYHAETVKATMELIGSAGLIGTHDLNRSHIYRRVSQTEVKRYDQIYPNMLPGELLTEQVPSRFEQEMKEASVHCFVPQSFVQECSSGVH